MNNIQRIQHGSQNRLVPDSRVNPLFRGYDARHFGEKWRSSSEHFQEKEAEEVKGKVKGMQRHSQLSKLKLQKDVTLTVRVAAG